MRSLAPRARARTVPGRAASVILVTCLPMLALASAAPPVLAAAGEAPGARREGGETIATAVPVTLPFEDAGETCDNVHDHDVACPYDGSTSPDVVYTFTPAQTGIYWVDLCGSSYDTKVYVYDADLNVVACNDDYYTDAECGWYVSFIELVEFAAGMTYFLVIDGYGGDCGEYLVRVCENPPCLSLQCAPDDLPEGEPAPVDGYVDVFNGGCDVEPAVFQELSPPAGSDVVEFCGTTGWYESDGEGRRDSDWLQVRAAGSEVALEAEGPVFVTVDCDVMEVDADCNLISVLPFQMGTCGWASLTIATEPGQTVTLRVRPTDGVRPVCAPASDVYRLRIAGVESVVPVARTTWSAVRGLYR